MNVISLSDELPLIWELVSESREEFKVNGVAIVILSHGNIGLSTCTTRYLLAMAMADLLVIITEVIFNRINSYYFPI
ncbi:uncharacterized protein LOC119966865 isoform X2 [Scyliorhinus canicula]|uniref:uncharacterized protein LOC119966865 isoform X2 n=1 Tax=Scyliorhinus canicula TaxID=7830 RepID=UPI0018F76A38|nr:uncharacterized protein LOC119966865 isoform X2 [Scyliorhinus canicula]